MYFKGILDVRFTCLSLNSVKDIETDLKTSANIKKKKDEEFPSIYSILVSFKINHYSLSATESFSRNISQKGETSSREAFSFFCRGPDCLTCFRGVPSLGCSLWSDRIIFCVATAEAVATQRTPFYSQPHCSVSQSRQSHWSSTILCFSRPRQWSFFHSPPIFTPCYLITLTGIWLQSNDLCKFPYLLFASQFFFSWLLPQKSSWRPQSSHDLKQLPQEPTWEDLAKQIYL